MIIDVHCHLFKREFYPEKVWRDMALDLSKKQKEQPPIEEILESNLFKKIMNATPDRLIEVMENAKIDKSVVFGSDFGLLFGEPKKSILDFNKYVADGAKEYPDKLIPFFTIGVRRPKSAEFFETALTKWEMKGLKLHPFGYYPNSEECYKLYEIADK